MSRVLVLCEAFAFLLIRLFVYTYTVITLPIYYCLQKPWVLGVKHDQIKAVPIARSDQEIVFRSVYREKPINRKNTSLNNQIDTMEKLLNYAANKYGNKNALGTREILAEEDEMQSNGTVLKKIMFGNYHWKSYTEMNVEARHFGRGLLELGLKAKENVAFFSETRAEWLTSAHGCMKQSMPVVTLYANLGVETLVHCINETEVKCVITSQELLHKLENIVPHTPGVSILIVIENSSTPFEITENSLKMSDSCKTFKYSEVIRIGGKSNKTESPPTCQDVAIVMYTSGSTGIPKGVVMSHKNFMSAMFSILSIFTSDDKDIFLGYLPLAHIFELLVENYFCLLNGTPIAYSSPLSMIDNSSKIKQGCKGDATVVRPTVIVGVPLMLGRIYSGIQSKIENGSPFRKAIFDFAVDYKQYWYQKGYETPILNGWVFKPVRDLLGGRVCKILSGGAPLSPALQSFMRTVLCCPIQQVYGMTEICGPAVMTEFDDRSIDGSVGAPLLACDVKLVNWVEGNHTVNDYPNPRGEIHMSCDSLVVGYYKQPEKTKEDFYQDNNGKRWIRSGDIGEFTSKGTLKIIDRKKELVKLQHGEFVSLNKVESVLKICPFIENICVYGDSTKQFLVALITPNIEQLRLIVSKHTKIKLTTGSMAEICSNADIEEVALAEIKNHSLKCHLVKFEIPNAIKFISDIWTPESGLVTSSFKLKRKQIENRYKSIIDIMYSKTT